MINTTPIQAALLALFGGLAFWTLLVQAETGQAKADKTNQENVRIVYK